MKTRTPPPNEFASQCSTMKRTISPENRVAVASEAKAIVALAFRNGPIEDVHAGKPCPTCHGDPQFSHITQAEMKLIMKTAVDRVYTLLLTKQEDAEAYGAMVARGARFTTARNEPSFNERF